MEDQTRPTCSLPSVKCNNIDDCKQKLLPKILNFYHFFFGQFQNCPLTVKHRSIRCHHIGTFFSTRHHRQRKIHSSTPDLERKQGQGYKVDWPYLWGWYFSVGDLPMSTPRCKNCKCITMITSLREQQFWHWGGLDFGIWDFHPEASEHISIISCSF